MQPAFDPYYRWLGIPPAEQPADYYRLLGIPQFELDGEVISNAADSRMGFVRTFQSGQHLAESQRLLNELSIARVVLLDPGKRQQYDSQLRLALQRNVPVAPAWTFHPPAPGYNAGPQQAPYLQSAPYPQPGSWAAPQAVYQPAQATFVGGALADADADAARARAEAAAAAPQIIKSLPPATRRRESLWRNPWMVAAGGTLLTIIAVFVMVRAGYNAPEPDFVDANLPEFTVPSIDVFGEGKTLPKSKDRPVAEEDESARATASAKSSTLPENDLPDVPAAPSSPDSTVPRWYRPSSPFAEFALSPDERWVATHTNTRGTASWAIYEVGTGKVAAHMAQLDGAATELRPAVWPIPGPTPAVAALFNVQGRLGVYFVTSSDGAKNSLPDVTAQALFTWGGSNGEWLVIAPDPKKAVILLFDRSSGKQVGAFNDFEPGSQLTSIEAKQETLLVAYRAPIDGGPRQLSRIATYSLSKREPLLKTHAGEDPMAGASLTKDGSQFDTWSEPVNGKITGARTAVAGGGSATFGFNLQAPGDLIDLRFAYSGEQRVFAVANRATGVLQLYRGFNDPPHSIRFSQGVGQLAFIENGSRLLTKSVVPSLLATWDTSELLTKAEAALSPDPDRLAMSPPVERSLASAVPLARGTEAAPSPPGGKGPAASPASGVALPGLLSSRLVEIHRGAGFVSIGRGTGVCKAEDAGKWQEVPAQLEGTKMLQNEGLNQGAVEFTTKGDGLVVLAVTTRFGGGGREGEWLNECQTLDQLKAKGWKEMGVKLTSDINGANYDWVVLSRTCRAGERFKLRTEKYLAPTIFVAP